MRRLAAALCLWAAVVALDSTAVHRPVWPAQFSVALRAAGTPLRLTYDGPGNRAALWRGPGDGELMDGGRGERWRFSPATGCKVEPLREDGPIVPFSAGRRIASPERLFHFPANSTYRGVGRALNSQPTSLWTSRELDRHLGTWCDLEHYFLDPPDSVFPLHQLSVHCNGHPSRYYDFLPLRSEDLDADFQLPPGTFCQRNGPGSPPRLPGSFVVTAEIVKPSQTKYQRVWLDREAGVVKREDLSLSSFTVVTDFKRGVNYVVGAGRRARCTAQSIRPGGPDLGDVWPWQTRGAAYSGQRTLGPVRYEVWTTRRQLADFQETTDFYFQEVESHLVPAMVDLFVKDKDNKTVERSLRRLFHFQQWRLSAGDVDISACWAPERRRTLRLSLRGPAGAVPSRELVEALLEHLPGLSPLRLIHLQNILSTDGQTIFAIILLLESTAVLGLGPPEENLQSVVSRLETAVSGGVLTFSVPGEAKAYVVEKVSELTTGEPQTNSTTVQCGSPATTKEATKDNTIGAGMAWGLLAVGILQCAIVIVVYASCTPRKLHANKWPQRNKPLMATSSQ